MHRLVNLSIEKAKTFENKTKVTFNEWSKLKVSISGPAVTIVYKKEVEFRFYFQIF